MQQQPIMTSKPISNLEAAYGADADSVIQMAKKRTATDADLHEQPAAKKTTNTVRVVLEDDAVDEKPQTKAAAQQQQNIVQESTLSTIDTKFDWRYLDTKDKIAAVMKISDQLSKSGDYLNVMPLSQVYSRMFNETVDCGYNFQFQTPPLVCTTGLRNSERFPGQWSALLASTENIPLITRLKLPAEVANNIAFLVNLQQYLNDHLVEHGETIFLNSAKRVDEENAKMLVKNPQAKVANNPYRQNVFVSKGPNEEVYKEMRAIGKYTEEKYKQECQQLIGSFFVSYEDKPPSVQIRAYPKKVGTIINNDVPDVVIINEQGGIETFNPNAPYCQNGQTSWVALLKLSLKWYDGMVRLYLHVRSFQYFLNNGGGASAETNQIIFTDAQGNKRRVGVTN